MVTSVKRPMASATVNAVKIRIGTGATQQHDERLRPPGGQPAPLAIRQTRRRPLTARVA